jgi:hypothetical protein
VPVSSVGAPTQIRSAAPASRGRKRGALGVEDAPVSSYLLGSMLTTSALADPVRASVEAIPFATAALGASRSSAIKAVQPLGATLVRAFQRVKARTIATTNMTNAITIEGV